jgi:hypothetical protein
VPGVKTAKVTLFYIDGGSVALNSSLVSGSDEIFRLKEENVTLV